MAHRIEVISKITDAQAAVMKKKIESMSFSNIKEVKLVSVYTLDYEFSQKQLEEIAKMLANPITQDYGIDFSVKSNANWIIEIGFLPGVTDNVANTAQEAICDLFNMKFDKTSVFTSEIIFLKGDLSRQDVKNIAESLANKAIQRIHLKDIRQYDSDKGMDLIIPRVKLTEEPSVNSINLDIGEEDLIKLGKQGIMNIDGSRRGPLALDLESMKVIRDYFKENENRMPTDIELESIAQTWSETSISK